MNAGSKTCPTRVALLTGLHSLVLMLLSACGVGDSSGPIGGGGGDGPPNPPPAIVMVDPPAAVTGGPDFYMRVFGSGFVATSVVEWGGLQLPTTYVNSTQVFAVVTAANRSASASYPVTVLTPAPGGGLSNSMSVLVGPAPAAPAGVGVIQLVSAAPDGSPADGSTFTAPALSADGRYVAFQSVATNLVPGLASGFTDIYIRDTCLGAPAGCAPTTNRVSVANDGSLPNGNSRSPAISATGRYVAFDSSATNLFPGSTLTGGASDVFVRDTCLGAPAGCVTSTILVSVSQDGSQPTGPYPGYGDARGPAISGDGRFVTFGSVATNLVPGVTSGLSQVYLRDTCAGAAPACVPNTTAMSIAADGSQGNAPSGLATISPDGRYISFSTAATNVLGPNGGRALLDNCYGASAGCTPSKRNLFVNYAGNFPNPTTSAGYWIMSGNARFFGIQAGGQNFDLVPGVPGEPVGSFVYDDCIGAPPSCIPRTDQVSLTYNGSQPDNGSVAAASSNDGTHVVFNSIADNLLTYAYRSSAMYVRLSCATAAPGCIPTTYLLSVDSFNGIQGNSQYSDYPAITPDGHYAVFISTAPNWPPPLSNPSVLTQVWLARVY